MSFTSSPFTCTVQGSQPWIASYLDEVELEKYLDCCRCAGGLPMGIEKFLDDILHARKEKLDKMPKTNTPKGHFNVSRSGTWEFMSAELLGNLNKRNTFQDDLESFFWVLLYTAIRYLNTSLSQPEAGSTKPVPDSHIAATMSIIFDTAYRRPRSPVAVVGGAHKEQVILRKAYIKMGFSVLDNKPLTVLIHKIIPIIREYQWTVEDLPGEMDRAKLENAVAALELANSDVMMRLMGDAMREVSWPIGDVFIDHLEPSSDTASMA